MGRTCGCWWLIESSQIRFKSELKKCGDWSERPVQILPHGVDNFFPRWLNWSSMSFMSGIRPSISLVSFRWRRRLPFPRFTFSFLVDQFFEEVSGVGCVRGWSSSSLDDDDKSSSYSDPRRVCVLSATKKDYFFIKKTFRMKKKHVNHICIWKKNIIIPFKTGHFS